MGFNEQQWLESDHGRLVKFYHRQVDNIICLFEKEHQPLLFVDFLYSRQPEYKLHYKREYMKHLRFLDVLNTRSDKSITKVYKKITFTFTELKQFCIIYIKERRL